MNNTATIQQIKAALLDFNRYMVTANRGNGIYEDLANTVWNDKILPFVKNETIGTWESDIQKKFIDNPYVRFEMSEKQAYCLARAYAAINPETIKA